jgi:hypothetical protein
MSDFITNFSGRRRRLYKYSNDDTLIFLKNIEKTNAYIGGEYIITTLNKINKMYKFNNNEFYVKKLIYLTLYIHWSKFLDFIILNIDDIDKIKLYFETIYTNTFLYVIIHTKKQFIYIIYIVPDDIEIVEYIKKRSITTLSEIWFYKNKLDGTNVVSSIEKKGYLKPEYLSPFIDNLDKTIISTLKKYSEYGFEITINTANYTKTEQIEYKNEEKTSILTFLSFFYQDNNLLEYFYDRIAKKRYSNLETFKNNILLFHKINFILAISGNNTYNLDNLKDIFYNQHDDNELINIIKKLIEKYQSEDDLYHIPIINYLKVLLEKLT